MDLDLAPSPAGEIDAEKKDYVKRLAQRFNDYERSAAEREAARRAEADALRKARTGPKTRTPKPAPGETAQEAADEEEGYEAEEEEEYGEAEAEEGEAEEEEGVGEVEGDEEEEGEGEEEEGAEEEVEGEEAGEGEEEEEEEGEEAADAADEDAEGDVAEERALPVSKTPAAVPRAAAPAAVNAIGAVKRDEAAFAQYALSDAQIEKGAAYLKVPRSLLERYAKGVTAYAFVKKIDTPAMLKPLTLFIKTGPNESCLHIVRQKFDRIEPYTAPFNWFKQVDATKTGINILAKKSKDQAFLDTIKELVEMPHLMIWLLPHEKRKMFHRPMQTSGKESSLTLIFEDTEAVTQLLQIFRSAQKRIKNWKPTIKE